ncbi:helix-turn-helix domain-containing protein [Patescibacteria group bacterium]|nr:helix-turn-helix domain-containing protein [Patescibacteria group bacterium]
MKHSSEMKQRALELRKIGNSYAQISTKMGISKSTIFGWTKSVILSGKAQDKLAKTRSDGVKKGARKSKHKMMKMKKDMAKKGQFTIESIIFSKSLLKVMCSFLYWGEGNKSGSYVSFINSDPEMIGAFMVLLRQSFELDESKFRILVHIHEYHHEESILNFWSKITNVPLSQFSKSYLKLNTKVRRKPKYMGCARIRYYNVEIVRELQALYNAVAQKIRAVG